MSIISLYIARKCVGTLIYREPDAVVLLVRICAGDARRRASLPRSLEVWAVAGEVVHARHGALSGAPAVCAILDEPSRAFAVEHGREAPLHSVHASWRQRCHEARCQLVDRDPPRVEDTWDIAVDDLAER